MNDASARIDRAWKLLDTNHAAIDRADAKAGAVLAACGISVGALIALYDAHRGNFPATAAGICCAALAFAATGCAGLALWPRRMRTESPESLLYFDHIARMRDTSAENYTQAMAVLFADGDALSAQITHQVWATARLASIKYDWVNRALVLLFGNLLVLGVAALLLVM